MNIPRDRIPSLSGFVSELDGASRDVLTKIVNSYRTLKMTRDRNRYMFRMYWDTVLSRMAENYASTCPDTVISETRNYIPGRGRVDQLVLVMADEVMNVYRNYVTAAESRDYAGILMDVAGELSDGTTNQFLSMFLSPDNAVKFEHATAMKLGCGLKACSPQKNVLVCNIAPRKFRQNSERMSSAEPSLDCPDNFNAEYQLCDCGDRNVCSYNALLYPVTCSCWCDRVFVSSVKPYVNTDDSCSRKCLEGSHEIPSRFPK
ncbi:uncharacterized protein LOC141910035 [Tubulanus polymorphus]|uniref:uncharacterized protein LOC141910035 n=1 Tax=Tubulanus polymorphus TaxID=672921 RepID=UPI003DA4C215